MNKRAIVTENDKKPHFPDQVFRKAGVNTMKLLYRDHLRDRSQWSLKNTCIIHGQVGI